MKNYIKPDFETLSLNNEKFLLDPLNVSSLKNDGFGENAGTVEDTLDD